MFGRRVFGSTNFSRIGSRPGFGSLADLSLCIGAHAWRQTKECVGNAVLRKKHSFFIQRSSIKDSFLTDKKERVHCCEFKIKAFVGQSSIMECTHHPPHPQNGKDLDTYIYSTSKLYISFCVHTWQQIVC
jgi:hypothetical protein